MTQKILIGQMEEIASDDLPERWKAKRDAILAGDDDSGVASQGPKHSLQGWLEEVYFDGHAKPDLTKEDIVKLGKIIGKLLYFEPSARASVRKILADPWFDE